MSLCQEHLLALTSLVWPGNTLATVYHFLRGNNIYHQEHYFVSIVTCVLGLQKYSYLGGIAVPTLALASTSKYISDGKPPLVWAGMAVSTAVQAPLVTAAGLMTLGSREGRAYQRAGLSEEDLGNDRAGRMKW